MSTQSSNRRAQLPKINEEKEVESATAKKPSLPIDRRQQTLAESLPNKDTEINTPKKSNSNTPKKTYNIMVQDVQSIQKNNKTSKRSQ